MDAMVWEKVRPGSIFTRSGTWLRHGPTTSARAVGSIVRPDTVNFVTTSSVPRRRERACIHAERNKFADAKPGAEGGELIILVMELSCSFSR